MHSGLSRVECLQPEYTVLLGMWNFRNFKPTFLLNGNKCPRTSVKTTRMNHPQLLTDRGCYKTSATAELLKEGSPQFLLLKEAPQQVAKDSSFPRGEPHYVSRRKICGHGAPRLQNNPYVCVFKDARAVKQKVWNEAENRERDWGPTGVWRSRASRAWDLLRHALPISLLILRKKTDCFAVYRAPKGSDSFQLPFISDRWCILTVWVCFVLYERIRFVIAKEKNTCSGLSRLRVSGIMTLSTAGIVYSPAGLQREIPTFKRPKDSAYVKPYSFFFFFHGPCQQLRFWGIGDIGQIQFSKSFAWSNCLACRLNKWLIFYHTKCAENFLSFLNVKITSEDRYFPRKWRKT